MPDTTPEDLDYSSLMSNIRQVAMRSGKTRLATKMLMWDIRKKLVDAGKTDLVMLLDEAITEKDKQYYGEGDTR
jgi:hypothetical protein